MALVSRTWYWAGIGVLIVLGIYMVAFHAAPLPANHEDIGLGKNHIVHTVFGIILLIGAVLVWRQVRRVGTPAA